MLREAAAKPLVESALLAAIGAILVLTSFYVPGIGVVAGLVCPAPFAVAAVRHGLKWGVLSSVVTALSLLLFVDVVTAFSLWAVSGLTGIAFGYAIAQGFSPSKTVGFTTFACLIGVLVTFLSLYVLSGVTPAKLIAETTEIMIKSFEKAEEILGPSPLTGEMLKDMFSPEATAQVLPAVILMTSVVVAYVNFEVMRRVLPRLGHDVRPLPPFSRWIFPDYLAFTGMLGFAAAVTVNVHKSGVLANVGGQVFTFVSFFATLEVVSLVSFFLLRLGFPRFLVGLASFFMMMSYTTGAPGLTQLFVVFGMMDMLADFRKLKLEVYG